MGIFNRKPIEKRSIEDILTPKDESSCEDDCELPRDDKKEEVEKQDTEITPIVCFGMEESRCDKWLLKCVKVWYYLMSFVWFLFGAVTFAPVIFISGKLNVLFKDKKKSLLVSAVVYTLALFVAVLLIIISKNNSDLPITNN